MNLLERIRVLRLVRVLSNLKYFYKLRVNSGLYKKHGIHKRVWQSISHNSIKIKEEKGPWLDGEVTDEQIKNAPQFKTFTADIQNQLINWKDNGFIVLPGFFSEDQVEAIEQSMETPLTPKEKDKYRSDRIINLHRKNKNIEKFFKDSNLLRILSFILGKEVAPYQTINFYKSSSQPAHSDAIHLTTEPLGYSLGVWVALEDIKPGSGEFFYYPGSHKLNYIMNEDYETGNTFWCLGQHLHEKYEHKIAGLIREKQIKPETFLPKKGDIMVWHTNLIHGSWPKTDTSLTRKSMVMHYFVQGVLCYHEMLEKPAVFFN